MRINWDTPVSELIHGDDISYIDLENDVAIHWKYIKREMLPNGKWRYYYRQADLDEIGQDVDKAQRLSDITKMKLRIARYAYASAAKKAASAKAEHETDNSLRSYINMRRAITDANEALRKQRKTERVHKRATEQVRRTINRYTLRKIISFPARTISKGYVTVANLLNGTDK